MLEKARRLLENISAAKAEALTLALQGERKLVTIMFADISGFTTLAETMDPEAVRDLIQRSSQPLSRGRLRGETAWFGDGWRVGANGR